MDDESKFWLGVWACIAAMVFAICAMIAFLGYQSANNQYVNEIGVACVTAGSQWVDNKCVVGDTTILLDN